MRMVCHNNFVRISITYWVSHPLFVLVINKYIEGEILNKILFAASTLEHIQNFHMPYLDELNQKRYEVHILADKQKDMENIYKSISCNWQKKMMSFSNIREIFRIKKILCEEKYKKIIVHTTLAAFCVRMAAKMLKEKPEIIYMCHGYLFTDTFNFKNKFLLFCEKIVASVTDKLIVMNETDLKIANKHNLGKEIFFTNGVGIDVEKFNFSNNEKQKKEYRDEYGFNKEDIIFLNVAEFSKRKNQKELIVAFKKLNDSNIKLVLAGKGREFEKCKKLSQKLGLEKNIFFMGHIKDVKKLYIASDYYISASKSEGMPMSVLEAASIGLPLLLSNKKGHKDIIKSVRGLIYNDKKDLTRKINDIIIYQREKNDMKQYDILNIKEKIIDIYSKNF